MEPVDFVISIGTVLISALGLDVVYGLYAARKDAKPFYNHMLSIRLYKWIKRDKHKKLIHSIFMVLRLVKIGKLDKERLREKLEIVAKKFKIPETNMSEYFSICNQYAIEYGITMND